ncbi:MAG: 2Fe-2S iron-sulfur cluster-binding protein [Xanthobacteraceae bacterium]
MPNIIFIEPDGTQREVTAKIGESAMEAAKRNAIDNILAECGGSCICATCHVYVATESAHLLAPPEAMELDTLEFTADDVRPESRLACQIKLAEAHNGLVLQVAPRRQP